MSAREAGTGRGRGRIRQETANDRFKRGWGRTLWLAVSAAVLVHFALFASGRGLEIEEYGPPPGEDSFEGVLIQPEIEVPAPPERISEPAIPEVEAVGLGTDEIPVEMVDFDAPAAVPAVPPPPASTASEEAAEYRQWVPSMIRPRLENPEEVQRALEREYPAHLIRAGVTGEVLMWFWIDEEGGIEDYEIKRSSGHDALDSAALDVVETMRFRPAKERGEPVKVIVALPIRFTID